MQLYITDGGRRSSGFVSEKSDCTVRALACALDIPYNEAHAVAKRAGRKRGRRFRTHLMLNQAVRDGILHTKLYPSPGLTLNRAVEQHPRGRFIIRIRNHVLALVDGVIHDMYLSGARCRVRDIWQIIPESSQFAMAALDPKPVKPAITQTQVNELWERLNKLEARI
jgi:hypothetical protein